MTAEARRSQFNKGWLYVSLAAVGLLIAAAATYSVWAPRLTSVLRLVKASTVANGNSSEEHHDTGEDDHHDDHHDDHLGHTDATAIEFTEAGLKNIGFEAMTVSAGNFERAITVPGIVVERSGHSQTHVTAPMTGVITRVHCVEGAAVEHGQPLFEIRLTHEELVAAQRDFLQTSESLAVVQREIARLQSVGEGVVAGRRVLEHEYERQKLQATLRAERQALLLHGLSEQQIDAIGQTRTLLDALTVTAPTQQETHNGCGQDHLYHVQALPVSLGEHVQAGQQLCVLADHCELLIAGRAFEDDAPALRTAAQDGRRISARMIAGRQQTDLVQDLRILYVSDQIDPESRALHFYLRLPNTIVLDHTSDSGRRYLTWQYRPGQRFELRVPVEYWEDCIVLPVEAVVDEGPESYVFEQNGDHFDRVAVNVEYRDSMWAVIANDGSLLPNDIVVARGAYQMHLALKNQSGGGVDPHAGHHH